MTICRGHNAVGRLTGRAIPDPRRIASVFSEGVVAARRQGHVYDLAGFIRNDDYDRGCCSGLHASLRTGMVAFVAHWTLFETSVHSYFQVGQFDCSHRALRSAHSFLIAIERTGRSTGQRVPAILPEMPSRRVTNVSCCALSCNSWNATQDRKRRSLRHEKLLPTFSSVTSQIAGRCNGCLMRKRAPICNPFPSI